MPKKNSVPYGWRSLQPVGTRVEGTRFIPFKVPLKGVINQRLTPNQKFTPKDLIAEIKAQGEELGLVIDLTNTNRYYEVKDLPKNVKYQKLPTAGLEIPDDDTILQFKKIVRKFLRQNPYNDKLIGVHCTTGLSRTGYLICRYLVDVDDWHPDAAIKAFTDTRNLTLDGRVYVADLKVGRKRTNEGIDDVDDDELPAQAAEPARADWSERSFPATQSWSDYTEQQVAEDGNVMSHNPFQENMNMEGYDFRRPVHGGMANDTPQESRVFQRPGQRPTFPENYSSENGRNPDFYQEPFAGQRSQKPTEEQYFDSRPEPRAGPYSGEPRDFREAGNTDLYDVPPGQRPRSYYGQSAQDDYQAQMHSEDHGFNAKPGQRMRPPMQGETHNFPSERVWDLQKQDIGSRPGPRGFSGPQGRAYDSAMHMEEDFSKLGYQQRPLPSHGFPNDGPVDGRPFPDRDFGQRPYGPQSYNFESDYETGKPGYNTAVPRMRVPPDSRPPFRMAPETEDGFNGPARRPNVSRDFSSYSAKPEAVEEQGNRPGPRPYSIYDSHNKEVVDRGFGRPGPKAYEGQSNYPPQQLSERAKPEATEEQGNRPGPRPYSIYDSHNKEAVDRGFGRPGPKAYEGQSNYPPQQLSERGKPGAMEEQGNRPGPRPYSIYDSHIKEAVDRGFGRPGPKAYEGQSNYPTEQLSERGPGYPAANKRMRLSDEVGQADRYAPPMAMGQKDNRRSYPTPVEGNSEYSYGAPEANLRGLTAVPRRSRFN